MLRSERLNALVARLRSHGFARAAGILVGGTAAAHMITALSLPVITRIYSPQDMAALAVFSSLLGIFAVSICLRFDVALSMPDDDEEAVNLLALGAVSTLGLCALLAAVLAVIPATLYARFGHPELGVGIWLLPPALVLAGFYSLFQFWFVRRRAFGVIAQSRVLQSGASAGAQIGLGALGVAPLGLLIGATLNSGSGAIGLGLRFLRRESHLLRKVSRARMREMFRAYVRFPKYSAAEALTNTAAIQLPVVLIAAWAQGPEAGYLMLALFVIQAPMSLLGTALGQVYLSEAPGRYRAGGLAAFTLSVIRGLARLGAGPLIFMAIVSPGAFGIVFGHDWWRAGQLVAWMTPWFLMQLLVTPVAMGLHVTNHQRAAFLLQLFGLALRVGSVAAAAFAAPRWISEVYAVSGFVFYFLYLLVVLRCVGASLRELLAQLRSTLPILLLWCVLGGVAAALLALLRHFWSI